MREKLARFLRREQGGIAVYVAEAVLLVAVVVAGILVIAATKELGNFMSTTVQKVIAWAK